jgi:hypothetical protein
MLTLNNIRLHEKSIQDSNNKFFPRINRLAELANRKPRFDPQPATTNFSGTFSIFEALYEMESLNNLPKVDIASQTTTLSPPPAVMTQDQYRDALITRMMDVDEIDQQFGRVH